MTLMFVVSPKPSPLTGPDTSAALTSIPFRVIRQLVSASLRIAQAWPPALVVAHRSDTPDSSMVAPGRAVLAQTQALWSEFLASMDPPNIRICPRPRSEERRVGKEARARRPP